MRSRTWAVVGLSTIAALTLSGCMRMDINMAVDSNGQVSELSQVVTVPKDTLEEFAKGAGMTGKELLDQSVAEATSGDQPAACTTSETDTAFVVDCSMPLEGADPTAVAEIFSVADGKITMTFPFGGSPVASKMTQEQALADYQAWADMAQARSKAENVPASELGDKLTAGAGDVQVSVGPKGALKATIDSWECSGLRFSAKPGSAPKGKAQCELPTADSSNGASFLSGLDSSQLADATTQGMEVYAHITFPGEVISVEGPGATVSPDNPNTVDVDMVKATGDVVAVANTEPAGSSLPILPMLVGLILIAGLAGAGLYGYKLYTAKNQSQTPASTPEPAHESLSKWMPSAGTSAPLSAASGVVTGDDGEPVDMENPRYGDVVSGLMYDGTDWVPVSPGDVVDGFKWTGSAWVAE